ncbi:hypothetical protein LOD99_9978 [Oopsacas minuta]|uniref:Calpain catalytic domain-containing protein n=1 Tax=Oopsacas minuta TaxID=111878 RepID=A0AAV7KK71_9METZ|nr:hypothetical protein LOD99_9978 [Oopsacas minuta]
MASQTGQSNLFEDTNFSPILRSIYKTLNKEAFIDLFTDNSDEIIWRRPVQISENIQTGSPPILFLEQEGMCHRIKQGGLANCYLTAAICAIVHANPKWIYYNIFTKVGSYPQNGKLTVLLFHNSQWEGVEIDDNIPCDLHGYPIFARCVDEASRCQNEWWLSLLEKAYAKIYGSYANLHGGNMSEALYDLTGVPVLDYTINGGKTVAKQPMQECDWECLWNAHLKGDAVCVGYCVSVAEVDLGVKYRSGISTNHAYALIGLFKNAEYKLVKIRNARCDSEFSGLFSRDSEIWQNGTKKLELTKVVGVPGDELPAGDFLMSYDEFITFFNRVYISRLSMENQFKSFSGTFHSIFPGNKEFGGCSNYWSWRFNPKFHIVAPFGGIVSVTLTQQDQRGTRPQLNYDQIGITVIRIDPFSGFALGQAVGDNLVAKTTFVNRRNVSVEFKMPQLSANEICVAIPSTYFPNVTLKWVLSVHSNSQNLQVEEYQFEFHSRRFFSGKWSGNSAGGGPKHPSFLKNPSYQLQIGEEATKVDIYMRQKILATQSHTKVGNHGKSEKMPKMSTKTSTKPLIQKATTNSKPKVAPKVAQPVDQIVGIGFYILKDFQHISSELSNELVYDNTVFTNREEIHKQTKLGSKQKYLLIPCTFQPKIEREFFLEIFSDKEIRVEKYLKSQETEPIETETKTGTMKGKVSSGVPQGMFEKSHKTVLSLGVDYNNI